MQASQISNLRSDREMSINNSDYTKYLPATLQADEIVDRFLWAFEQILTGRNLFPENNPGIIEHSSSNPPGIEAVIDSIHTYFNPDLTPEEFLPWLASWVALSLRDDWKTPTKRKFIKQIVPLYRLRGTQEGLREVLSLYLESVELLDEKLDKQKKADKIKIYQADYFPDCYFQVEITLPKVEDSRYWQVVRIAKAIIQQEKPAHTYYGLKIQVPSMQITGNIYPLKLTSAGAIAVNVTKKPESTPLRLSIKSGFGQAEPYNSMRGDSLRYTITPEQFNASKNWYVIVDNLSNKPVKISLSIDYPDGRKQSEELALPPGLKIYTKKSDGKIDRDSGNTSLGTNRGAT
jgi:phage tail-like protein